MSSETGQPREQDGPQEPPSRGQQLVRKARERWKNRPSFFDLYYVYVPLSLVAGGLAVGIVDEVLDTNLAETMAEVTVDTDESTIEQVVDHLIHEIGTLAVEAKED